MRRRLAAALVGFAATAAAATAARAQPRVVVTDVGPGASGPILQQALRRPHRLADPDTGRLIITREVRVRGSLIVLGRTTQIDGEVEGDVLVVDGDLFVTPGARVGGDAIAIGGGVYPSALAHVAGRQESYRDNTFTITRVADGYRLAYRSLAPPREPPLLLPGVYGFRPPQYDHVNGLSLPFGPAFAFGGNRGRVDLLATWRSDLGVVDPSLDVKLQATRRTRATLALRRGSLTNEDWIWPNLLNSWVTLVFGEDTRNFYRADRAEVVLYRLVEGEAVQWEPFIGAVAERARSVGPTPGATSGPWSLLGREDTLAMRRPNPAIDDGDIRSLLVGTGLLWESQDVRLTARSRAELSLETPTGARFQQVTTDVVINFPTFGEQSYGLDLHWVTTLGDKPPRQRSVYLGGGGTLPFLELLTLGGDELLLIDQRYTVPLLGVTVGAFGNPSLQLRHRIATAGLGTLPPFETMLGFGISLTVIRGEIQLDPPSGRVRGAAGFTFTR